MILSFSVFSRERKYVLRAASKGNKSFPRSQFQVVVDCTLANDDYLYSLSWKQQVAFSAWDSEKNFLERDCWKWRVFFSVGSMSCCLQSATGHFQWCSRFLHGYGYFFTVHSIQSG
jgi:hypothetical protein